MRWLIPLLLMLAAPASAAPEWRQAHDVEIRLSSFDIQPAAIRLKAGQPVRLRLINDTEANYLVAAPRLFAQAEVRGRDRRIVRGGRIYVPGGETREVLLAPARGRYSLSSGNIIRRILGMRSRIDVD